ncbi:MAG: penicillin-insensitive murein endopeptidase [Kofleriaceae bacterium]
MRLGLAVLALAGCAELGVVGDGTTVSAGRASGGHLVEGTRIPDQGDGWGVRETWRTRGNRWGTDELVDLLIAVSRRMTLHTHQRLYIADLSKPGGGPATQWHASHQTGRDVDLLYYLRDRGGQPVEAMSMQVFDAKGNATDGSGYTVDVPRTWLLVRELLSAPEADVQWIFLFDPLGKRVIEHAVAIHEPDALIAKARIAIKQPGKVAPHDDHMHVRIYCPKADVAYGCVDTGPMDLRLAHDAERAAGGVLAKHATTEVATLPATTHSKIDVALIGRLVRAHAGRLPD